MPRPTLSERTSGPEPAPLRELASRIASRVAASARTLAAVVVVGVFATGCGSPGPSPSPTPSTTPSAIRSSAAGPSAAPASPSPAPSIDEAALYRQIEDDVIALRGLPAKQRLEPTILDQAQLRVRLKAQFLAKNPPEEIAASQATLVAMGLLPAGTSLADLYVNLLGSQVAGYYDPATKRISVVARAGQVGAIEKVTFAHEFTHALQDQNFGLKGIQADAIGHGDRSIARLALIEGDASLLMTQWLAGHLDAAGIAEILAGDPAAQAQLDATPAFLKDALLFPYLQGVMFVNSIWAKGGWAAVDRAFATLPDSTEQVLHADKYAAHEQPVSVPLDAAAIAGRLGAGWKATRADTLGEFQIGSWLRARGVTGARRRGQRRHGRGGMGRRQLRADRRPERGVRAGRPHDVGHAQRRGRVRHRRYGGSARRPGGSARGEDRARRAADDGKPRRGGPVRERRRDPGDAGRRCDSRAPLRRGAALPGHRRGRLATSPPARKSPAAPARLPT